MSDLGRKAADKGLPGWLAQRATQPTLAGCRPLSVDAGINFRPHLVKQRTEVSCGKTGDT